MKKASTFFLRAVVISMGMVILGLCIFALPLGIVLDHSGVYRPILLGMYIPAIPFYIALYQTMKLLRYIDTDTAFSLASVDSLRIIKQCGKTISALYALGMPYIAYVAITNFRPGVFIIDFVFVFAALAVSVFAAILERLLRKAIDFKIENDLTV